MKTISIDLNKEIWKDIVDYEGIYQVSNYSRIRNNNGDIRKTKKNNRDYTMISLYKDGKEKTKLVHRLVAQAFIPNPNNLLQVNHIDEDKNNNNATNLEWCSNLYNRRYGTGYQRSVENHDYKKIGLKNSKRVKQYDLNSNFIKEHLGVMIASRETGINESGIRRVCYKKAKSAGGFRWEYCNENN